MFVSLIVLTLLSISASLVSASALDEEIELNLSTDVVYEPADAWHHVSTSLSGRYCENVVGTDHYTTTIGANMTFQFTGEYGGRHRFVFSTWPIG